MTPTTLAGLTLALLACKRDPDCPNPATAPRSEDRRGQLVDDASEVATSAWRPELIAKAIKYSRSTPQVYQLGSSVTLAFNAGAMNSLFNGEPAGFCSPGLLDVLDDPMVRKLLAAKITEVRCTSDRCAATFTLRPRNITGPAEPGELRLHNQDDDLAATTVGDACASYGQALRALQEPE